MTVSRLHSSGTFARTLILRKPLAFIGKTLKKYVTNSLKYRTFMKTHFNYVFIQIKRLISDVCALVVLRHGTTIDAKSAYAPGAEVNELTGMYM